MDSAAQTPEGSASLSECCYKGVMEQNIQDTCHVMETNDDNTEI